MYDVAEYVYDDDEYVFGVAEQRIRQYKSKSS